MVPVYGSGGPGSKPELCLVRQGGGFDVVAGSAVGQAGRFLVLRVRRDAVVGVGGGVVVAAVGAGVGSAGCCGWFGIVRLRWVRREAPSPCPSPEGWVLRGAKPVRVPGFPVS